MDKLPKTLGRRIGDYINKLGIGTRTKLIIAFLVSGIIPLVVLIIIEFLQIVSTGDALKEITVSDSTIALNDIATENIERMTTDTAQKVAEFLYARDADIRFLADMEPLEELYTSFVNTKLGRVVEKGSWKLNSEGTAWVPVEDVKESIGGVSTNTENDDRDGFSSRASEDFEYENIPLYDEVTFVDLNGNELIKITSSLSPKISYPMSSEKKNISIKENTYVKAENYFEELKKLNPGEIYVSDVIGAYVGSNYIGMYAPDVVQEAAEKRGYDIDYNPEE